MDRRGVDLSFVERGKGGSFSEPLITADCRARFEMAIFFFLFCE